MRFFLIAIVFCAGIPACSTYQPSTTEVSDRHYLVRQGDNFHSIAFAFEISVERLKAANPWLDPANLAPGMRLTIPRGMVSENVPQAAGHAGFIWPLHNLNISSGFGYRYSGLHEGVDLRAPRGTAIRASAAGRVVFSGRKTGYGRMIIIDHGNGMETVYAHNASNRVGHGQQVEQGQVIASVGRSGNATGYHVHFEIRRDGRAVDPSPIVGLSP